LGVVGSAHVMTRSRVDVVVVGAGIAGLSVAAELARDADVLILEQHDQPATQATGRSAAQFIVDYGGPQVRPFTEASREWFESGDEFVRQSLLSARGMLIVAAPGDEHVLADHASPSRHAVDLAAVTDLFPAARPERIGAALFDPTVADIDVAEAVAARGRALVERKVVRRWGEALVRGGRVGSSWRIETTAQTWWADEIVDAAGAWGDAVAESCGIATIGLRPLRRTACTFRASSELMHERWPLLSDARETWYLKPEPGQFLASPLTRRHRCHPTPAPRRQMSPSPSIGCARTPPSTLDPSRLRGPVCERSRLIEDS
jgi:D-arginine dehydrogenase